VPVALLVGRPDKVCEKVPPGDNAWLGVNVRTRWTSCLPTEIASRSGSQLAMQRATASDSGNRTGTESKSCFQSAPVCRSSSKCATQTASASHWGNSIGTEWDVCDTVDAGLRTQWGSQVGDLGCEAVGVGRATT